MLPGWPLLAATPCVLQPHVPQSPPSPPAFYYIRDLKRGVPPPKANKQKPPHFFHPPGGRLWGGSRGESPILPLAGLSSQQLLSPGACGAQPRLRWPAVRKQAA